MLDINFCSGRPIVHIKQGRLSGKRRKTKNGNDFTTLNIYLSHNFICAPTLF